MYDGVNQKKKPDRLKPCTKERECGKLNFLLIFSRKATISKNVKKRKIFYIKLSSENSSKVF